MIRRYRGRTTLIDMLSLSGRKLLAVGLGLVAVGLASLTKGQAQGFAPSESAVRRSRIVVTTDGEVDDRDSMTRLLMMANEWEIEGLIYSSSQSHWLGREWAGVEWIQGKIAAYARDYPNLRNHAEGYPTP